MKALLFDLDGTLADTERQCAESVARALAKVGRHVTDEERDFVIGRGWGDIYAKLVQAGGGSLSQTELIATAATERERIVADEGLVVLPGAIELLRAAAARLPTTVVSGSSRGEIAACLRHLGIDALIRQYVGAEDVARGKPDPEGYLLGARQLGVAPVDAVAIEDSTAGIAAAKAAGMVVVAVRAGNFAGQDQSGADLIVGTLSEVDLASLTALHAQTYAVGRHA